MLILIRCTSVKGVVKRVVVKTFELAVLTIWGLKSWGGSSRTSIDNLFGPHLGNSDKGGDEWRLHGFYSISNASVRQAPSQWLRWRRGAEFPFNASVCDTPSQWLRWRQGAKFCSLFNASVCQAPSQWLAKGAKIGPLALAHPLRRRVRRWRWKGQNSAPRRSLLRWRVTGVEKGAKFGSLTPA